ncbi:hypothetical protein IAR55_004214 [Kwoniella newhampshirensis]|uniref:Zn(2)-C6 fungal-type domain-containing protein n=1 Tax=Kwoniella newhampshirensis TaxID=1651941 RepID=A0AAW0YZ01_9TREE
MLPHTTSYIPDQYAPAESSRSAQIRHQHDSTSTKHTSFVLPREDSYRSTTGEGPGEVKKAESSRSEDSGDGQVGDANMMGRSRKKQKMTRARNACLPCRSRKRRCGGTYSEPCASCLRDEIPCTWPTEDGRSSQARKERSKSKVHGGGTDGDRSVSREVQGEPNPWTWMMSSDWLESFGTAGAAPMGVNSSNTPFPPPLSTPSLPHGGDVLNGLGTYDIRSEGKQSFSTPDFFSIPSFPPSTEPPIDLGNNPTPLDTGGSSLGVSHLDQTDWTSSFQDIFSSFDPAHFVLAMSSRLPTVEEGDGSLPDTTTPDLPTIASAVTVDDQRKPTITKGKSSDEKIVKVTWWRPHGQTAITPGLKRIILKVRVNGPHTGSQVETPASNASGTGDAGEELFGPDKMPSVSIMKHLYNLFIHHFGSQFPYFARRPLEMAAETRTASVFLLHCIAAIAARFSSHPAIAQKHLQPSEYGNEFYKAAKELLGSMLAVPTRETVIGLILLGHVSLANDSEAEVWMLAGMAVRMAIDLGLHLNPPQESNIPDDERRLDRLVFWPVLLFDFALSFGTGRQTTLRVEDITQLLPSAEDVASPSSPADGLLHPFPYAARQMLAYGHLINILNSGRVTMEGSQKAIQLARTRAIGAYNALPAELAWSVTNLQQHSRVNQAPIYLHLHLWMHTIIASGYLTGTDYLRRNVCKSPFNPGLRSGAVTPNAIAASHLWRNSARTIGDILVLSDIINPTAYLTLPFCNQAFYVAGCCYIKEIEDQTEPRQPTQATLLPGLQMSSRSPEDLHQVRPAAVVEGEGDAGKPFELFKALVTSVAANNISTVQQGLAKQTTYWSGIEWIAEALAQRMGGIGAGDIDLAAVTEKLASSVYVPDAGVLSRSVEVKSGAQVGGSNGGLGITEGVGHEDH